MIRYSCTAPGSLTLALVVLLAVAGCSAITLPGDRDTPCVAPETRTTLANGDVAEAGGATLASATVSLAEYHDGRPSELSLAIYGRSPLLAGPLRGHVLAVRVVGANGTSLFSPAKIDPVPATEGGGALVRYLWATYTDSVVIDGIRSQLMTNALVVELQTDYPSFELVRMPMRLAQAGAFLRPPCFYV